MWRTHFALDKNIHSWFKWHNDDKHVGQKHIFNVENKTRKALSLRGTGVEESRSLGCDSLLLCPPLVSPLNTYLSSTVHGHSFNHWINIYYTPIYMMQCSSSAQSKTKSLISWNFYSNRIDENKFIESSQTNVSDSNSFRMTFFCKKSHIGNTKWGGKMLLYVKS